MKTLKKSKETNSKKVFEILKVKELLRIKGGGNGTDGVIPVIGDFD